MRFPILFCLVLTLVADVQSTRKRGTPYTGRSSLKKDKLREMESDLRAANLEMKKSERKEKRERDEVDDLDEDIDDVIDEIMELEREIQGLQVCTLYRNTSGTVKL